MPSVQHRRARTKHRVLVCSRQARHVHSCLSLTPVPPLLRSPLSHLSLSPLLFPSSLLSSPSLLPSYMTSFLLFLVPLFSLFFLFLWLFLLSYLLHSFTAFLYPSTRSLFLTFFLPSHSLSASLFLFLFCTLPFYLSLLTLSLPPPLLPPLSSAISSLNH